MLSSLNLLRQALLVLVTGDGDLRVTVPVVGAIGGFTCREAESVLYKVEEGEGNEEEGA